MNNLLELGFTQEFIDKLIEKEGFVSINGLNNNIENMKRIITIVKELQVEDINDFIYENTSLFYQDYKKIKNIIDNTDLELLVEQIKEDSNNLAQFLYLYL